MSTILNLENYVNVRNEMRAPTPYAHKGFAQTNANTCAGADEISNVTITKFT